MNRKFDIPKHIFSKERILLLGGHGFIGSSLAARLYNAGYEVHILSSSFMESFAINNYTHVPVSLSDTTDVLRYVRDSCISVVVHLASRMKPSSGYSQFQIEVSNIVESSLRLFAGCATLSIPVVYFSSGGTIYGPRSESMIQESAPCKPITLYGRVKLLYESAIRDLALTSALRYLIIRPSNIYGPSQRVVGKQGFISAAIYSIRTGSTLQVFGHGDVVRDYLYIDDLTDAVFLLINSGKWNATYNLSTGIGHSLLDVVDIIENIVHVKLKVDLLPGRPLDVSRAVLDSSKLSNSIPFSPYSLEQGLEILLQTLI